MKHTTIRTGFIALAVAGIGGRAVAAKPVAREAAAHRAAPKKAMPASLWKQPLSEDERVYQVLDRLGFGPRPGDVDAVRQEGVDAYIQAQLHPGTLPDAAVEQELRGLTTLDLPPRELAAAYDYRAPKKPEPKKDAPKPEPAKAAPPALSREEMANVVSLTKPHPVAPPKPAPAMAAEPDPGQGVLLNALKNLSVPELQEAKVIRAVDSNRQLQEVMVDFWTNHFNIDVRKDMCQTMKTVDDRAVIRPFALGKFRDLLGASAKSPAMLEYLDNARSYVNPPQKLKKGQKGKPKPGKNGINENYAREIMELHTLGVDGGYTQKDVQEVARCFTGWGIDRKTGEFRFEANRHDDGEKTVLGTVIPAGGGERDGEIVLDLIASNRYTARHVARQLCQRFVADNPPDSVVGRAATVFRDTDGDISQVMQSIVTSPEFFSKGAFRAKVKSPFEYAVSCVRALNARMNPLEDVLENQPSLRVTAPVVNTSNIMTVGNGKNYRPERRRTFGVGQTLAGQIAKMGEALFQYQPPTGYGEDSARWLGAGALLARLNFALALTAGQFPDVTAPMASLREQTFGSPAGTVQTLFQTALDGEVSSGTRALITRQTTTMSKPDPALLAALVLGSPEFQKK